MIRDEPSYSKLITELQRLLVRVADHEEALPHVGEVKLELEAAVQDLKAIRQWQQHHWWAWRHASKKLQQGWPSAVTWPADCGV